MKWTVSISVIRISRQFSFNWRLWSSFHLRNISNMRWAVGYQMAASFHAHPNVLWCDCNRTSSVAASSSLLICCSWTSLPCSKAPDTTTRRHGFEDCLEVNYESSEILVCRPAPVKIQNTRILKFIIKGISRNNIDLTKYSTRKNRNHK